MEVKIRTSGQEETGFYVRFWIKGHDCYDEKDGSAMIIYNSGVSFFKRPKELSVKACHAIMIHFMKFKEEFKTGDIIEIKVE